MALKGRFPTYIFLLKSRSFAAPLRLERGAAVARLWVGLSDLNQLVPMTASSESTIGSGELSSRAQYREEQMRNKLASREVRGVALRQMPWCRPVLPRRVYR